MAIRFFHSFFKLTVISVYHYLIIEYARSFLILYYRPECGMCLCLPCFAGTAWAGWQISKSVDDAFTDKTPQEWVEPAIVTEAKLALKINSKPSTSSASSAPELQKLPSRSISKKEAASKARLQELIDKHAPSRKR